MISSSIFNSGVHKYTFIVTHSLNFSSIEASCVIFWLMSFSTLCLKKTSFYRFKTSCYYRNCYSITLENANLWCFIVIHCHIVLKPCDAGTGFYTHLHMYYIKQISLPNFFYLKKAAAIFLLIELLLSFKCFYYSFVSRLRS